MFVASNSGSSENGGDAPGSIGDLYQQHRERLIGLAAAITLDPLIAEEVVHDAFVGLQRHHSTVDKPVGYLQRSVINLSVSRIRRRRLVWRGEPAPRLVAESADTDEMWQIVVKLPPKQRAVVALRYWEDMTVADIAETLGIPAGSVKSTLNRALSRLRKDLVS
jgi:RNA polymerase sigma factor (sigma-70 family)